MDFIKKQLTWQQAKAIRQKEANLQHARVRDDNVGGGNIILDDMRNDMFDLIEKELDASKEQLRIDQDCIGGLPITVCANAPPVGTQVYLIDPEITNDATNLDSKGLMQLGIVRDPCYGLAVRFIAEIDGPVLIVRNGQGGDVLHHEHNMMRLGTLPGPLYHAGDLLEYRGPIQLDRSRTNGNMRIDRRDFGSLGSSLRLIKIDNAIPPLPENAVYQETAADYTIIDESGCPRVWEDLTSWDTTTDVTLNQITGRVVSETPLCSVITYLPEGIVISEIDVESDYFPGRIVYVTPGEMATPIEPQVKSATKRI